MPPPGRCVLGTKMVWRTGPSSVDLVSPTTPTIVHSMSSPAVGVVEIDPQTTAQRVAIGELLPYELFADDGDGRRVHRVGLGKITSGHLWNTQRLEESRA